MIEFQENILTDVKREEWKDPVSWDPSSYCLGSNKYNCSRLAFKVKDNKYNCSGPYLKVKKKKKKKNASLTKNYCITVGMQKIC